MHQLQAVEVADAPEVAAFIAHVIQISVDASAEEKQAFIANTRKNLALWQQDPAASLHLKCSQEGRLAGVLLVRDCWNLCHLFVAPELQGRGLGRAFVEAAIAQCRTRSPRGLLRLNAARNARAFYEHLGFTPVADAPEPYRGVQYEWRF